MSVGAVVTQRRASTPFRRIADRTQNLRQFYRLRTRTNEGRHPEARVRK